MMHYVPYFFYILMYVGEKINKKVGDEMPRKRKAKIDKDGYVHFLNDKDGLSSRDYLLIISTAVFFGFITIGLVMLLFNQRIDPMYIELLGMVDAPLMTIVAGIMSVNGIQIYTENKKEEKQSSNKDEESEI